MAKKNNPLHLHFSFPFVNCCDCGHDEPIGPHGDPSTIPSSFRSTAMKLTSWLSRNRVKPIRRQPRLRLQLLEDRVQPAVYYLVDGSGNNLGVNRTSWGAAGTDLIRL